MTYWELLLASVVTSVTYPELSHAGADVRMINFEQLLNAGILHSKFWVVDGLHTYIGSANMDWRSLTQVYMDFPVSCIEDLRTISFDEKAIYWSVHLFTLIIRALNQISGALKTFPVYMCRDNSTVIYI